MFPYNGQFHLAIGEDFGGRPLAANPMIYGKRPRVSSRSFSSQAERRSATKVLPSADLRVATAYTEGIAPKSPPKFYLVIVDKDGALKLNKAGDLTGTDIFDPVPFTQSGSQKTSPKWNYVTYTSGKLFRVDENNSS
jgi:hypothetical protein